MASAAGRTARPFTEVNNLSNGPHSQSSGFLKTAYMLPGPATIRVGRCRRIPPIQGPSVAASYPYVGHKLRQSFSRRRTVSKFSDGIVERFKDDPPTCVTGFENSSPGHRDENPQHKDPAMTIQETGTSSANLLDVLKRVIAAYRPSLRSIVRSLTYSLAAVVFVLLVNVRPARAAWNSKKEKQVTSASVQQFAKDSAPKSSMPGAPIDWGRSLPDEEEWPAEEREGLEGDLREHDIRDSQIDHAFEVAETSETDGNESSSEGTRLESTSEKAGHHWEGDLPAYDRQLKEIKAAAERERKNKKRVISWPLRIASVRDSHPQEWMKIFPLTQGKHVAVSRKVVASHADLLKKLAKEKAAKKLPKAALLSHELVSIGGAWLKPAVQQGLLTPLPFAQQSEWWERVGPKWRRFVTRNGEGDVDMNGTVYAAPYRFGHLVIAYRSDMLDMIGGPIEDWQDLFRPELKGRIAMLGAPQEVVGIVLKSLGASANARNFNREVPGGRQAVLERYLQLRKQVRVFGDVQYAPALRNGDVLAAVGWSDSFASVTSRISAVKTVTPASGTLIWADFWGVPSGSDLTPVSQQWLDYCLQPERAKGLGAEKMGLSPLILPPFPESPIPGLPLNAQLPSTGGADWRMAIGSREEETAERRQSGVTAGTNDAAATNAAGRARFNGLYAPRMAVSAQVSGVGKGPFEKAVTSGQLPRLEVLEKSELLEPLDEQGQAEFRWLLSLMEETATEDVLQRMGRRWGEAVKSGRVLAASVRTKVDELRSKVHALRAS